jgi:4-amino-4-deoxy-L-arabinose transferase-like glycosyltransferase
VTKQPPASAVSPPWRQPRLIALAALMVFVATIFAIARSPLAVVTVFEVLVTDGAIVAVWLTSAWGWGAMVAPTRIETNRPLAFATSTALGLGALSLLELLVGLAGFINRFSAIAILLPGLAFACLRIARFIRATNLNPEPRTLNPLWLVLMPSLAIAIVGATVPAGILWGDEPNGYDVVEYHLQVPREWYELGRIAPLTHNVFSYFPMNVEMHYLLAMQLHGGPWQAMFLAQLMHVTMMGLCVVAAYGVARALGESRVLAMMAALLVGAVPWSSLLAPVAYVEGGLMLFGTLALGWFLIACRSPEVVRPSLLAGAFAGFACGAKLTAVPMLVIALPLAGIFLGRSLLRVAPGFLLAAVLTLSPWLIRNLVWTGNPLFPEATSIFSRAHWTDDQIERWQRANHAPRVDQQSLGGRARAAWEQFIADGRYGLALLPAALIAAAQGRRSGLSRALLALLVLTLAFWLFFTHLQSRFLVLAVPVMALLIALAPPRRSMLITAGAALTGVTVTSWMMLSAKLMQLDEQFRQRTASVGLFDLLGLESFDQTRRPELEHLRDDQTLVLVGDAKAFLYQRPMSRLRYRTVFDVQVDPGKSIIDAWATRYGPNDLLLIDPQELRRLSRTYWKIPSLAPEFDDRVDPFTRMN